MNEIIYENLQDMIILLSSIKKASNVINIYIYIIPKKKLIEKLN